MSIRCRRCAWAPAQVGTILRLGTCHHLPCSHLGVRSGVFSAAEVSEPRETDAGGPRAVPRRRPTDEPNRRQSAAVDRNLQEPGPQGPASCVCVCSIIHYPPLGALLTPTTYLADFSSTRPMCCAQRSRQGLRSTNSALCSVSAASGAVLTDHLSRPLQHHVVRRSAKRV